MPIPSDLYERISQLVAENRVNSAIELLEDQLPALQKHNPEQYHAALVLMQDFNEIQERKINGLLVAETETNSFSFRLLEFSRVLGRKLTSPPPPPAASPDPLRVAQPAYSVPKPPPVTKASSSASEDPGGGIPFGKMMLYGLAGLGVLFFILIIVLPEEEVDDTTPTETLVIEPTDEITLPPLSDVPINLANLSVLLGNSRWITDDVSETGIVFSEDGSTAREDLFLGRLEVQGYEDGHYYGTLSEEDSEYPGMDTWLILSNDRQMITIIPIDDDGHSKDDEAIDLYRRRN